MAEQSLEKVISSEIYVRIFKDKIDPMTLRKLSCDCQVLDEKIEQLSLENVKKI